MKALLKDKLAVVTGAGGGIGRGIAEAMHAAGAQVVAVDLDEAAAQTTAARIGQGAFHAVCDITDRGACDALASAVCAGHGRVDILVNNAGIARRGSVREPDARAVWDAVLATNLDGAFNMVTACLDALIAVKGVVVNVASVQAFRAGDAMTAYCVSKSGIAMMTQSLATELTPLGVRVNAIAPGFVETPMTVGMVESGAHERRFAARVPLGRSAQPEDIALPAVFLASDMAGYVTGITLPVDGGYLCY